MQGKAVATTLVIRMQSPGDVLESRAFHQPPPTVAVLRTIPDREKGNFIIVFTNREDVVDFIYFHRVFNVELRLRQVLMAIHLIQSLKLSNTIYDHHIISVILGRGLWIL